MQLLASEEYGLRCLLQVARGDGEAPVSIPAVARAEGISPDYVAKLLRRLRLAGLVHSTRGADGGYRLARPAGEITVWSALEALGGEFFGDAFCACHAGVRRRCARSRDCSLRPLWRELQEAVRKRLERIQLADLLRDEPAMSAWLANDDLIRIEGPEGV
jgi:Rrf2 family protein